MNDIYSGKYMTAHIHLKQLKRMLPNNILLDTYLRKTKELVDSCRGAAKDITVEDALLDPIYNKGFYEFCKGCDCLESINIWNIIHQYKQLHSEQEKMNHMKLWKHYLDIDDTLNIESIQKEELLLKDIWVDFKETASFIECVAHSNQALSLIYMNYL